jgi:AraC family transcriptional regulator
MEKKEAGVIQRDGVYFHSVTPYGKEHLFYVLWGAVYDLDAPYRVERNYMDAYMVQYIVHGELHFTLRGQHFVAKKNELVILSCQEKNLYWAESKARVKWFHFHGEMVSPLLEYIYKKNGSGLCNALHSHNAEPYIDQVLEGLKNKSANEFQFSHYIYSMLCELMGSPALKTSPLEELIQKAVRYMKKNLAENITVEDMAKFVGVSVYHFSRSFKKYMSVSPHSYLLELRLDKSKNLLISTTDNLDIIAEKSGFQSTSHFIRAFKKAMDMTPKEFRQYLLAQ